MTPVSIGVSPSGVVVYQDGKPILALSEAASRDLAARIIREVWK